jgi:chloramphenicol-sensitive protein RarD
VALAITFSLYGLIRKQVPVNGLVGLAVETIVLVVPALAYLVLRGDSAVGLDDGQLTLRLTLSGAITAIPLLCFGQAARRLPLSVLGFLQYLSPSIQFLLAVFLFHERLRDGAWESFAIIWIALGFFSIDSCRRLRRAPQPA